MKRNLSYTMMIFLFFLLSIQEQSLQSHVAAKKKGFVSREGVNFMLNGHTFYANGFNAYWLMYVASISETRNIVTSVFEEAVSHSLRTARTWGFADGGDSPLQEPPGVYNKQMFEGLDFVVSEAKKYGIKLILSLVNNYDAYGGKAKYVDWANKRNGQNILSPDGFFTNPYTKTYYKNHIKAVLMRNNTFTGIAYKDELTINTFLRSATSDAVLTRKNTITGIAYKDEPTIMAWELMNEPRCTTNLSGETLQNWIVEMASYLKSIDPDYLLEVGLEGFYGQSDAYKQQNNTNFQVGTDFISNNNISEIDFATVHAYPDNWLKGKNDKEQFSFLTTWLDIHIEDAQSVLGKPVLIAEFGKSSNYTGYNPSKRDDLFNMVYSAILSSAGQGGAAAGSMFWQLLTQETENFQDGYGVVFSESPTTANLIKNQSQQLNKIGKIN